MRTYKCLNRNSVQHHSYSIVPIRKDDIIKIKEWRNGQMKVLRQKRELTNEDQERYFNTVIFPLFDKDTPSEILFSLLLNNECIGYGGLVHVSWEDKRAEVSFLVDTERYNTPVYAHDFSAFLTLIKEIAFKDLKFHRLFTETYDIRDFHISILEENSFLYEGRMKEHVFIDGKYIDSLLHGCLNINYA